MARLTQYLYRHSSVMHDNVLAVYVYADGVAVSTTPTRFILTLENASDTIELDTDDAAYDLGVPGTSENFRFDTTTGILTMDLGGDAIATFPAGTYDAELIWFDANNTNGIVWKNPPDEYTIVIE